MNLVISDKEVDINEHLPAKLRECLGNSLDYIHKFDTEEEWQKNGMTKNDKFLRYKLWRMLDKAVYEGKMLTVKSVYADVCSRQTFYNMVNNPVRCGYFFSKPVDHDLEAEVLLDKAKNELVGILSLPNRNDKGFVIPAVVNAKVKVYSMLMDRVLGQTIQRVEQKTITKNIKDETNSIKNVKQLEKDLRMLEARAKEEIIDV